MDIFSEHSPKPDEGEIPLQYVGAVKPSRVRTSVPFKIDGKMFRIVEASEFAADDPLPVDAYRALVEGGPGEFRIVPA